MATSSTSQRPPLHRLGLVAAAFLVLTAACDFFGPVGKDTATIEVTAEPNTPVRVITSNNFAITFDDEGRQEFLLFQVDSGWVEVPHTQSYDLRETGMFFVQTAEAEDPDALVGLRVLVDGDVQYDHSGVIQPETAGFRFYFLAH